MAELKINKEWIKDAVQPVIDDVKANYIHKSVIENIKVDIKEYANKCQMCNVAPNMEYIIAIFDKHCGDMRGDTDV